MKPVCGRCRLADRMPVVRGQPMNGPSFLHRLRGCGVLGGASTLGSFLHGV